MEQRQVGVRSHASTLIFAFGIIERARAADGVTAVEAQPWFSEGDLGAMEQWTNGPMDPGASGPIRAQA
jgi:hypothetical protein